MISRQVISLLGIVFDDFYSTGNSLVSIIKNNVSEFPSCILLTKTHELSSPTLFIIEPLKQDKKSSY